MSDQLHIKELLYKMADDLLIIGHRNGEWTGFGPLLEEDIAFSSMAQDKIGQSLALYTILNQMGEQDPDTIAFMRNANQFHCSQLVEQPNGEYDFSLVRHFLYDHADLLRFESLATSAFSPLGKVARKVKGEVKYHVFHGDTFLMKLGNGNEESHTRMQNALDATFNLALGIFEPGDAEEQLISEGVFIGEKSLQERWLEAITPVVLKANLRLPAESTWQPVYGGRKGQHSTHLQPLLDEMTEVFRIDPGTEW